MKAYAVANIEVKGRMAEAALFTRTSSVGKWKGDVAKKYDFCLSRRSGAHGVGSAMSTTSGNCTLFAGLEQKWHAVRFSVWLDNFRYSILTIIGLFINSDGIIEPSNV